MFQKREPFMDSAVQIIASCVRRQNNGYVSSHSISDLEDALQMQCAQKCQLDFIITRNIKDFENSAVKAITPDDFINMVL